MLLNHNDKRYSYVNDKRYPCHQVKDPVQMIYRIIR